MEPLDNPEDFGIDYPEDREEEVVDDDLEIEEDDGDIIESFDIEESA